MDPRHKGGGVSLEYTTTSPNSIPPGLSRGSMVAGDRCLNGGAEV